MIDDEERCYRAVQSRDPRFDGWFFVAVTSTGIYCRPSCPALLRSATTCASIRAPRRPRGPGSGPVVAAAPTHPPGSPEWNVRRDLVGRAMRLIADGLVDREGVGGVARRLP